MSYQAKLMFVFAFFVSLAVALMLYFSLRSQKELVLTIEDDLRRVIGTVHHSTLKLSADKAADQDQLAEFIGEAKKNPALREISVISSSSEVVASSNERRVGSKTAKVGNEVVVRERFGSTDSSGPHTRYEVTIPIVRDQKVMGVVQTTFILNDLDELLHRLVLRNSLVASFCLLALFIASTFVLYRLNRPIRLLSAASQRVASGDSAAQVNYQSRDEVGRLTESFNAMTRKLQELRTMEEQLRALERRAILSETAATMAHEIRNPLNLINLTADHLAHEFQPKDEAQRGQFHDLISSLKTEVKQLNRMVGEFLDIGKPMKLAKTTFALAELVGQVETLVKQQLVSKSVELSMHVPSDLRVSADMEQMRLVLLNLLLNAVQASPDAGAVTVRAGHKEGRVEISVSDSGQGIGPEALERLFEPYFTRKPDGVGLGLALCRRIVEEHSGRIRAYNAEAGGAVLEISLPAEG